MFRVFVVDDHPLMRSGIKQLINQNNDFVVTGEAGSVKETFHVLEKTDCDVLMVDLKLEDGSGFEILETVRKTKPDLPIVIFSMYSDDEYALRAYKHGASGFFSKGISGEILISGLKNILNGEFCFPQSMYDKIAISSFEDGYHALDTLSPREKEVLSWLHTGKPLKEISSLLDIDVKTVSTYKTRIFRKLHVGSMVQLINQTNKFFLR